MGILRRMHESYGDERFGAPRLDLERPHPHPPQDPSVPDRPLHRPTPVAIGVHRKPRPDGKPGFL